MDTPAGTSLPCDVKWQPQSSSLSAKRWTIGPMPRGLRHDPQHEFLDRPALQSAIKSRFAGWLIQRTLSAFAMALAPIDIDQPWLITTSTSCVSLLV
jgi:hypothetical protein